MNKSLTVLRNKKIILTFTSLFVTMFILGRIAYGFYRYTDNETIQNVTADINDHDGYPDIPEGLFIVSGDKVSLSGSPGDSVERELIVVNGGSEESTFTLKFILEENTFIETGDGRDVTVEITSKEGTPDLDFTSVMPRKNVSVLTENIPAGGTYKYNVKVAYNDTGALQNDNMGKTFKGHFEVEEGFID